MEKSCDRRDFLKPKFKAISDPKYKNDMVRAEPAIMKAIIQPEV